ncbi:hypothetical protein MJO28_004771 [Puccinia striiformis f. sp. tritici]|nr:uncharacterized protein Pst134EA_032973 [Puccinia striiformis f. sp. tritici]XP_047807916.1 hypothetical protein Pst134EA_009006 [Puccinia striiformis f. sp. tritici]KAI9627336.1 hypothetical protein H4Q26_017434 [Puccinia striiformis f. sp. tritici PST-130]KAH9440840.1 hypothetical protein Pst134EA_032973 [Puccinia striiformis f. sp. tritici]KAH9457711.1 hypothetical protein Pst134EB_010030 [Puccinia striiformis f. sp. tritici]KAH9468462.1 hypothetical protein Pst134EA_009006 [Puccinia str
MMTFTPKICFAVAALLFCMVQPSTQLSISASSSTSTASDSASINGKLVSATCVDSVNGVTAPCGSAIFGSVPLVITRITP